MKHFKDNQRGGFIYCQNLGLQTIATKYLGPTDTKGARIKAVASGGETKTVDWNYAEDTNHNHASAALELAGQLRLDLQGVHHLIGGSTPTGNVYVLVGDIL
tara:strand:+ start:219 stop:524 length:306 start_codon:yes stop_codon:yes gene_type:complete